MRKYAFLAPLAILQALAAFAQDPNAQPAPADGNQGPSLTVDLLYWQPMRQNLDFAANDITEPTSGRKIESVTPDFSLGIRAMAELAKHGTFSLAFRLTFFGHDTSESFSDPDGDGGPTRIHPTDEVLVGDEDLASATSKYTISYTALDIEILLDIVKANGTRLQGVFGFRYAAVREKMDTLYLNSLSEATTVNEKVGSTGFGLYCGMLL